MTLSQIMVLDGLSLTERAGLATLAAAAIAGGMGRVKLTVLEDVPQVGRVISQHEVSSHAIAARLATTLS